MHKYKDKSYRRSNDRKPGSNPQAKPVESPIRAKESGFIANCSSGLDTSASVKGVERMNVPAFSPAVNNDVSHTFMLRDCVVDCAYGIERARRTPEWQQGGSVRHMGMPLGGRRVKRAAEHNDGRGRRVGAGGGAVVRG